jgi:DNA processing protein
LDTTDDLLTAALLPRTRPRQVREMSQRGLADVLGRPDDHPDLLCTAAREVLRSGAARRLARDEEARAASQGIRIVGWDDADYPWLLRQIFDPPPVLYARGSPADQGPAVAIVGARAASIRGFALAQCLARDLAEAGASIVSGLARGIDTAAHQGALDARGRTVAVLGSALDNVYPPENTGLASRIPDAGALVSEFPLGTGPTRWNFPRRNRVIAGWVRAVVVVEAGDKSGALITARLAAEEGRDVMAVPGHPSDEMAGGTNQLIRDGAALVRGAMDVLEALQLSVPVRKPDEPRDDLLRALRPDAPASVDEIHATCGRPIPEILARLAELEIGDKVRRLPGALYVRN